MIDNPINRGRVQEVQEVVCRDGARGGAETDCYYFMRVQPRVIFERKDAVWMKVSVPMKASISIVHPLIFRPFMECLGAAKQAGKYSESQNKRLQCSLMQHLPNLAADLLRHVPSLCSGNHPVKLRSTAQADSSRVQSSRQLEVDTRNDAPQPFLDQHATRYSWEWQREWQRLLTALVPASMQNIIKRKNMASGKRLCTVPGVITDRFRRVHSAIGLRRSPVGIPAGQPTPTLWIGQQATGYFTPGRTFCSDPNSYGAHRGKLTIVAHTLYLRTAVCCSLADF
jgi:hypothetical protein